jgi:arsenical-resistance protein 2
LLHAAGVELAVFYCGGLASCPLRKWGLTYIGSSNGRGPRAAAWLQDYINGRGDTRLKSVALQGGIKGWVKAGEEFVKLVEGYDADVWKAGGEGC